MELPKAYSPQEVEEKISAFWEAGGFFKADSASSKPPFCIVIPPPNVTGILHMGHGLVNTLQDILIRYKRMQGFEAFWVPGTDHAGIATQTIVERHLIATHGKTRKEFSREEFLHHVWAWKEKSEKHILHQLKELGCSCDWSRLRFTMDPEMSRAVRTAFKHLFDAELIYRGDYLVNWDSVTQTALADDEVEYEERQGALYTIRYPLAEGDGEIAIATTRPETLLGDVAVAVAPSDERYRAIIGKKVRLPLLGRLLPILADNAVDPTFGTGALKITPAHDPVDYEIGLRHGLERINILTPDGKMNEAAGPFAGLSVEAARQAVVQALKKENLLIHVQPITHRVGLSYRSKAVIEPYLSKQWFVKMSAFKKRLIQMIRDKEVKLIPDNWENIYFHWIENLRDWCISRQLWWGHRIPIWYNTDGRIFCSAEEGIPADIADEKGWRQDDDVLDTWFSSALWPFAVLGYPEQTPLLDRFYPTSTLITGHDILFFWVARMLCMGDYLMGRPPFPETFLHGLIYGKSYWREKGEHIHYVDAKERHKYDLGEPLPKDVHVRWEKMSKSKGNVIDPLEMVETYGADALRFALTMSCTHARQIDLDRRRFEEFKHFSNKIWNGARFVLMNLDLTMSDLTKPLDDKQLALEDRWILARLEHTITKVTEDLDSYHFDKASSAVYTFYWDEFCAYFVELCKPALADPKLRKRKQQLLLIVLTAALRLMHPFAPFITEELFQKLKSQFPIKRVTQTPTTHLEELVLALAAPACAVAPFPRPLMQEPFDTTQFDLARELTYSLRNLRAEMQLPPKEPLTLYLEHCPQPHSAIQKILKALFPISAIHFTAPPPSAFAASSEVQGIKLTLPLPSGLIEREKERLKKEKETLGHHIETLKARLANPSFVQKAPKLLVEKLTQDLAMAQERDAWIAERI